MDNKTNDFEQLMNECTQKMDQMRDFVFLLSKMHEHVANEKKAYEEMVKIASKFEVPPSEVIRFNIGGTIFATLKSTIEHKMKKEDCNTNYGPTLFQLLISGLLKPIYDESKAIFIDRSPRYYNYIFDYLRAIKAGKSYEIPKLSEIEFNEFKIELENCGLEHFIDLINKIKLTDSPSILTKDQRNQLNQLCEFDNEQKFNLLYRASRDGFGSDIFHKLCDGKMNTLTIVKTTNGYIFGGYTTVAWETSGNFKPDANAFLFTLVNPENKPLKLKISQNLAHSIYCNSGYGPTFGGGHDLRIYSNSNLNQDSYSNLGHTYQSNGYVYGSTQAKNLLAGSYNFQSLEIEVYEKA